jgi:hypothetical protein
MTTIGLPNVPVLEGGADPARLDGQDPQSRRIDVWREHERKGAMSRVLIIDDELPIRQVLAARPKIIAMSGGGAQGLFEVKSTVRCLGADRVLLKPFEPRTLVSTVQEVLDGHA